MTSGAIDIKKGRLVPKQRALKGVLLGVMLLFIIMSLVSAGIGISTMLGVFDVDANASGRSFLMIQGLSSLVAGVVWALIVRLVYLVRTKGEVFSKRQSRKLYLVGGLFAVRFVSGLFLPVIHVNGPSQTVEGVLGSAPTVDIFMLSLAVLFFALGAVFEYGRILQEDSDNIL